MNVSLSPFLKSRNNEMLANYRGITIYSGVYLFLFIYLEETIDVKITYLLWKGFAHLESQRKNTWAWFSVVLGR